MVRQIRHSPPNLVNNHKLIGPFVPYKTRPHIFPMPNGMLTAGDSRAAGMTNLGLTAGYTISSLHNQSSAFGWVLPFCDHCFNLPANNNYGVASSTSLNFYYRTFSPLIEAGTNPAGGFTGVGVDSNWNSKNNGSYSLVGHPANVVFIINSINDVSAPSFYTDPIVSMKYMSLILDALSNKTVFLSNEIPKGTGFSGLESHAVSSSTCTATNTTGFEDGSTIGIPGLYNGTTGAIYTKVASGPAIGEYSVNSSGVYTFNASDTITVARINYTYTGAATSAYQITMHHWLQSDDAQFRDPSTNVMYPISGALYRRPWVISIDTWGAVLDPLVANTSKRGTQKDSIHPTSYGEQLIAQAVAPIVRRTWPSLRSKAYLPIINNMRIATGNGATSAYSVTLPSSMLPVPRGQLKVFTGEASSKVGRDDGAGNITGTGISSGTINYNTGALSITFSASVTNAVGIFARLDGNNALDNGMMDPSPILGSNTPTGTGASGSIPAPWTGVCTNMGGTTATFSTTTDDDGYPAIRIVMQTATGVAGTGPITRLSSGTISLAAQQFDNNGPWKASAKIKITAGPDGFLTGLTGVGIAATFNPVTGSKPGQDTVTSLTLNGNQGTANIPLTDLNLVPQGGMIKYTASTPSCDLSNFSAMSGTISFLLNTATGWPISATVIISRASFHRHIGESQEYGENPATVVSSTDLLDFSQDNNSEYIPLVL